MKTFYLLYSAIVILTITGCQKQFPQIPEEQSQLTNERLFSEISLPDDKKILVDASKDGGVWWFPQSPLTGFSESDDHQGKYLADYLRSLGYHVDELPREAVITEDILADYSRIIRVSAFFPYTEEEITAYKKYLSRPGAILLLQDHLSYTTNDGLSELLGLEFKGSVDGVITPLEFDDITEGVLLPFIAGSVVTNTRNNANITVLGVLKKDDYIILNNGDPFRGEARRDAPVMGVVNNFPSTRIFFLGDGNGIESVPQPFTQNLFNWLFQ